MSVVGVDVGTKLPVDVFGVAAWLEEIGGGPARAVSSDLVEWMCSTWGSGKGRGDRLDTGLFLMVASIFGLDTWCNKAGRNELVVSVPLDRFSAIAMLIEEIGADADSWPWLFIEDDDDERKCDGGDVRLVLAASVLGTTVADLIGDGVLLEALGLD
jgi:hypothetical protein